MGPFEQRRRFRPRWILAAAAAAAVGAFLAGGPAAAGDGAGGGAGGGDGGIDVVQVEGFLDPPNADLIEGAIERAEERGSTLLVLQLDSGGALDVDVDRLVRRMCAATVPIAVWIGPPGADARGGAALLATAAPVLAVAPGAGIGPAAPARLDRPGDAARAEIEADLAAAQEAAGRAPATAADLARRRVESADAVAARAADSDAPTVGELIVSLDGTFVATADGPVRLDTADVVGEGRDRRRQPNQDVRFANLGLVDQLVHTLTTPWVAYVLLLAGLVAIAFEFFTAGIGAAGLVGGVAVIAAGAGFGHLPVRWWAVGLLVGAVVAFCVDVQAGTLGPWSVIGAAAQVVGSLGLYGGSARLDPAWWIVAAAVVATALFFVGAMTSMVRARFSTPTIGREAMVGETGTAEVDVAPEGVVQVRGARWRARTHRATPIAAGAHVRVVAVEGLVLHVEPAASDPL